MEALRHKKNLTHTVFRMLVIEEGEKMNAKEELIKLVMESYDQGVADAKQEVQRQWVGLTVDEIHGALLSVDPETKRIPIGFARFAYAIETKLKEKNCADH